MGRRSQGQRLRVGNLNVGTMTGKASELVMEHDTKKEGGCFWAFRGPGFPLRKS